MQRDQDCFGTLYENIAGRKEKIAIVGLGYVGLPIAIAFSKKADVIGFDLDQEKINLYESGVDPTKEIGNEGIRSCNVTFTAVEKKLKEAKFFIIAVPTPVKSDHSPDLSAIEQASRIVGRNIKKGAVVVYESTVYPGVTEEICIPILEKESGLRCGADFKVGYSPERINPGDKNHRLDTIVKIVSGMDEETLDIIGRVYELVALAGVYKAESIKVAEAAKVIENSQRDVNIAFMNELSIIFNKMHIDTNAVLKAARTKWNFLDFTPGLVGGHCIGVDPYYLTYKAQQMGYHSQVILSGRRINDNMGKYVVENVIKSLIEVGIPVKKAQVAILGFTFKENCSDTRNTKVIDIVNGLIEYGIMPRVADPVAEWSQAKREHGIEISDIKEISDMDVVVIAVNHKEFLNMKLHDLERFFSSKEDKQNVLIDVKGIIPKEDAVAQGYYYWRL